MYKSWALPSRAHGAHMESTPHSPAFRPYAHLEGLTEERITSNRADVLPEPLDPVFSAPALTVCPPLGVHVSGADITNPGLVILSPNPVW
jgi:hypothetical protein